MHKLFLSLCVTSGVLLATYASASYDLTPLNSTTNQQYFQGVPVFGGQEKIHTNAGTGQRFITGRTSQDSGVDVVPTVSAADAITIAQNVSGQAATTVLKSNLYVFNEHLLNKLKPDNNVLVWQIELYQAKPFFHEYYFIDAHSSSVVYQMHGSYDAITRQIYDCSYWDGNCYIEEYDPVWGYTLGRSEGEPAVGFNPYWWVTSLTDTDDLYTNLGNIYDYYVAKFGRQGANGNNGMGDGTIYPTADTTGLTYIDFYTEDASSCPNAFFDGIGGMHYCEGFVTNDISGHEYAHAVNYFSILDATGAPAGLSYTNEIGALNEANSDVFGEALEYYVTGTNDWLLGEDSPLGTLRSMSNPPDYTYTDDSGNAVPYPDRYNSENLYCGTEDSGGVHTNSSVVNKAAYLIAMGGTFNTCTITGIGRDNEEAIFYRAETTYYTTSTDFNGAYTALLAACHDLYTTDDCKQVEKALRATELNQAGFCSGTPAVDPGCIAVDTGPTILDVTSTTANGYYKAGATIDIDFTFSEAVTGDAIVTLETGDTDRTCTFSVAAASTGSCNYIVSAGDTSAALTVQSIIGTLIDENGDPLTETIPTPNLADNKSIVIDTTKPTLPTVLRVYSSPHKTKRIKTLDPHTFSKIVQAKSLKPYFTWGVQNDVNTFFVKFTDKKKLSRAKLLNSKNKQTKQTFQGSIDEPGITYYLHMILQDRAGNRSNVNTIVRYKSQL